MGEKINLKVFYTVASAFLIRFGFYVFLFDKTAVKNGLTGGYLNEASSVFTNSPFMRVISDQIYLDSTHPKGYSVLLAIFKLVFNNNNWLFVHVFQALTDALVCYFIYKICVFVFKDNKGEKSGLISAWIYALLIPAICMNLAEGPDAFSCFFFAFVLFLFVHPMQKKYVKFILIGLVFGIAIYFRAEFMYLIFVFAILELIWKRNYKLFNKLIAIALSILVMFTILSPWMIYSKIKSGFVLVSSSNLWGSAYESIGEDPSNSERIVLSDEWITKQATMQGFYSPWSPQADNYFKAKTLNYIKIHPGNYLKNVIKNRIPLAIAPPFNFWNSLNKANLNEFSFTKYRLKEGTDRYATILKHPFEFLSSMYMELIMMIISILLLIGFIIFLIKKRKEIQLLLLFLLPWAYYVFSISAIKQIEPRNVAPNLVIEVIAFSYLLITKRNEKV
jgi:4-amino-4-deoxy-L-arabinose transferase-like glycosyltransferase